MKDVGTGRFSDRPTVTVEEAADYLGIGRSTAYDQARAYRDNGGDSGLPSIKVGGRVLVITAMLVQLVGARPSAAGDESVPTPDHSLGRRAARIASLARRSGSPGRAQSGTHHPRHDDWPVRPIAVR